MAGALSHIRVLDLTRVLAGPWCTQNLADLGADVIKIERPGMGDDTRQWGPPWVPDGNGAATTDSTYYTSTNRNKRSVTIDISKPEGQALVREMVAKCDVLVENYKVGDLKRYGLGYEDLQPLNPRLIYCSVTGYGQNGPYADRPGYDFVFQGEGGLMSITGERDDSPGGGPIKVGIAVTDILTGLYATIGITAALESRNITGKGQYIDAALLDTIVAFGANQIADHFMSGNIPKRWGNAHPNMAPYQVFKTANGHVIVACGNDGQFQKLCGLMNRPELAADPELQTVPLRNNSRVRVVAEIQKTFLTQTSEYWLDGLAKAGVPHGPINNYKQVFAHPQVVARKLRVDIPGHKAGGSIPVVASPLRLSDTPVTYRLPPPVLGEHTNEVLGEILNKSAAEIDALKAKKIV